MHLHRGNVLVSHGEVVGVPDVERAITDHNRSDLMRVVLAIFRGPAPARPVSQSHRITRDIWTVLRNRRGAVRAQLVARTSSGFGRTVPTRNDPGSHGRSAGGVAKPTEGGARCAMQTPEQG